MSYRCCYCFIEIEGGKDNYQIPLDSTKKVLDLCGLNAGDRLCSCCGTMLNAVSSRPYFVMIEGRERLGAKKRSGIAEDWDRYRNL